MEEWTPDWLVAKFHDASIGGDVLIGIDDAPWSEIEHAYGAADDVPALLRAIFSEEHKHGDFALDLLFGNIWHQGTVYEATRYVPPFLTQILQSQSVLLKHRISVVHLLHSIANGNSYLDMHYYGSPDVWDRILAKEGAVFEEEAKKELLYVHLAREAVVNELDEIFLLLNDQSMELICNLYIFLAGFQETSNKLFSIIEKQLHSAPNYELKEAILESVRFLDIDRSKKIKLFHECLENEEAIDLRGICGLGLLELQQLDIGSQALDALLEFVKFRSEHQEDLHKIPSWRFVRDDVISHRAIARSIIKLSSPRKFEIFSKFIRLVQRPTDVVTFVRDLLFSIFPDESHKNIVGMYSTSKSGSKRVIYANPGPTIIEYSDHGIPLNPEFAPVLKMLLEIPLFWEVETNLLNIFNLPSSKADLLSLINN